MMQCLFFLKQASEFCGITLNDIDFKTSTLNIDHRLQRTRNMEYVIEPTKTPNGARRLPMSEEVKEAFQRIQSEKATIYQHLKTYERNSQYDISVICLPRQVSCTINRTWLNWGKVGHNVSLTRINTTVSTTKG